MQTGQSPIYYNIPHNFRPAETRLAQTIASHVAFAIACRLAEVELQTANRSLEAGHHGLEQLLEQEQILARTDGLTGLYNRRYFFELAVREFSAAVRYQHPITIILFDIDGFKHINDTFGHMLGDKVLEIVAQTTLSQVRDVDVLARYGGDEFIILLPQTGERQAFFTADRIRERVASMPITEEGTRLAITLSIGVSELSHTLQDQSVDAVIRCADQALYMAKQSGRNHTIIFSKQT